MTRKILNVMLTGATLTMLAAAPALAQSAPIVILNALAANALNLNALSANALAANIITLNALAANALSTNSAGALGRVVAVELPRR
jgi:hypothetical protein